ncbi:hypothetical protein Tco_1085225 [Tanacetum coccineum]
MYFINLTLGANNSKVVFVKDVSFVFSEVLPLHLQTMSAEEEVHLSSSSAKKKTIWRKIPESPWGSPIPIGYGDGDVNRFPDGDGDGDGDEAEKWGWGW